MSSCFRLIALSDRIRGRPARSNRMQFFFLDSYSHVLTGIRHQALIILGIRMMLVRASAHRVRVLFNHVPWSRFSGGGNWKIGRIYLILIKS